MPAPKRNTAVAGASRCVVSPAPEGGRFRIPRHLRCYCAPPHWPSRREGLTDQMKMRQTREQADPVAIKRSKQENIPINMTDHIKMGPTQQYANHLGCDFEKGMAAQDLLRRHEVMGCITILPS